MGRRRAARARSAGAALLLVAATGACTGTSRPRPASTPDVGASGRILGITITASSTSIVDLQLPDETATTNTLPATISTPANAITYASAPDPQGGTDLVVIDERHRVSVYRLLAGGTATPAGPPLQLGEPKPFFSLSVANGSVLVGGCSDVWSLTLSDPVSWKSVAKGCWATLSPDATSIVYSPDLTTIDQRPLRSGGRSVQLLADATLRSVFPDGSGRPTLVGQPEWGSQGIAFGVRSGEKVAVTVRDPSGRILVALREEYVNPVVPRLSWQPAGTLLGIDDNMGSAGGVLRLFDPTTSQLSTIGLDPLSIPSMQWSPDGRSLASLSSANALIIRDVQGNWRLRVETKWVGLLAWTD